MNNQTTDNNKKIHLIANTIRMLSAEGVEKANSGHPGMPMGMADVAAVLWTEYLNHNPNEPKWINRDRFVLSAGHGSMLIYSLLHLSGYDVTLEELKSFRQWGSRTAGHPEYRLIPGIETTTGPLGQGFATGIGMAIASKMLAERFRNDQHDFLGNNFIYGIVSDGDLMEGISHEAASIAGHLKLDNIIYFYDDNQITIEGNTDLTFSENTEVRFQSYGWNVLTINAHDYDEIRNAIESAQKEKEKPTLIISKSNIAFGSPSKVNTSDAHGSPLGKDELIATKKNLNWPLDKEFFIPEEVKAEFENGKKVLIDKYSNWESNFKEWKKAEPEKAILFDKYLNNWLPENLEEELLKAIPNETNATRSLSSKAIQKIAELVPNFVGGSADLAPSTNTFMKKFGSISSKSFAGKNFHFGIREHAMGAILNGIVLHGGFRAFGATFFVFSDYMRPAIRLAAIMELPVIYVFTHDSIFVGEDGPTHQPVEQLAVLRAIPNVTVIRPADGKETAIAWSQALTISHGPVALILTRQKIKPVASDAELNSAEIKKGAYIISKEKNKKIDFIISASGSELPLAFEAKEILEKDYSIRVVSIPSKEIFERQSDEYRNSIFPDDVPVVVIEAALMTGWGDLFRQKLLTIGMNSFGASGPYETLAEKFGFTTPQIVERIKFWINK